MSLDLAPFRKTRRSLYVSIPGYVVLQRVCRLRGMTLRQVTDALFEDERLVATVADRVRAKAAAGAAAEAVRRPGCIECAQGLAPAGGDGHFSRNNPPAPSHDNEGAASAQSDSR